MTSNFYEYGQNNSGGNFVSDDKLCRTVIIEANSQHEADSIALDMGIYFDGCSKGIECNCCGDRWFPGDLIELGERTVSSSSLSDDPEKEWEEKYSSFEVTENPKWVEGYFRKIYQGKIKLNSIQNYIECQRSYSFTKWTTPDIRVFFLDGRVEEYNF